MSSSPKTYVGALIKGVDLSTVEWEDIEHLFMSEGGPFHFLGNSGCIAPYEEPDDVTISVVDDYNEKGEVCFQEFNKEDVTNCIMGFLAAYDYECKELFEFFPDASLVFGCVQYWE